MAPPARGREGGVWESRGGPCAGAQLTPQQRRSLPVLGSGSKPVTDGRLRAGGWLRVSGAEPVPGDWPGPRRRCWLGCGPHSDLCAQQCPASPPQGHQPQAVCPWAPHGCPGLAQQAPLCGGFKRQAATASRSGAQSLRQAAPSGCRGGGRGVTRVPGSVFAGRCPRLRLLPLLVGTQACRTPGPLTLVSPVLLTCAAGRCAAEEVLRPEALSHLGDTAPPAQGRSASAPGCLCGGAHSGLSGRVSCTRWAWGGAPQVRGSFCHL